MIEGRYVEVVEMRCRGIIDHKQTEFRITWLTTKPARPAHGPGGGGVGGAEGPPVSTMRRAIQGKR